MAERCSVLVSTLDDSTNPFGNPIATAMLSWAEGYFTGMNMIIQERSEPAFNMNSLTRIELWSAIYGHCKRNPDHFGMHAVINASTLLERIESPYE